MEPPPRIQPSNAAKPVVLIWYKVYLAFLGFLFLAVAGLGAVLMLAPLEAEDLDGLPPELIGGIYLAMGLLLFAPVAFGFFLPKKPWVWVYHLVMICIGMTGCTIVFSIPLLIFWLKPEVKTCFGRD
ncbi:MAG: hypothetical protein L3J39_03430 [Verrucomicrobiales bacterium]|nr:hypothetical protein [Verrucomicrobiales bacterium]